MTDNKKTDSVFEADLKSLLEDVETRGFYRQIRTVEMLEGNRARFDGRDVLLFCGNDYLGLSRHPRLIRAFQEAAVHGTGSGAARLISGGTVFHKRLEEKIAVFKGREAALLFSTGYLANLGMLSALAGPDDVIIMDKLSHASLVDGARLSGAQLRVFPHKNYERCEDILRQSANFNRRLLVTDSVFSMDGDLADLGTLCRLRDAYDAVLIADDAHGTGVLGPGGRGFCEDPETGAKPDVVSGTLSKAVGCLGGFVAGSGNVIKTLINRARPFIFATSLPPAVCAAAHEAFCVFEEEPERRQRLDRNVTLFQEGLKKTTLDAILSGTPIFPVILGEEQAAMDAFRNFLEKGYFIPAIRYPSVARGKARLRVTLNSEHSPEEILELIDKIQFIKNKNNR